MTAQELINRCNIIQAKVFEGGITRLEKNEFRDNSILLKNMGYKLSRRSIKTYDGRIIGVHWSLKEIVVDNSINDCWVKFAPPCDHSNQCTTRALFFCLNENIPYNDIRLEQNYKAKLKYHRGRCYGWNMKSVWETVLTDRDFVKIFLPHQIKAYRVAKILGCVNSRILVHANHHCLSVYGSKVYDSWNSTNKKCDYVMCHKNVENDVKYAFGLV